MDDKYYLDTSIWMDLYEDRKGFNQEPLGEFALKLFNLIKAKRNILVISDLLIKELEINYSTAEINGMINPFHNLIQKIFVSTKQRNEAKMIAIERNIPKGDALHAIIARDNKLILITRDNHFKKTEDICKFYKPEDII